MKVWNMPFSALFAVLAASVVSLSDGLDSNLHSMYWYRAEYARKELSAIATNSGEHFTIATDEKITTQHYFGNDAVDHALDMLQLSNTSHILDAGAGMGGVSRYIAHKLPDSTILSVDINSEFIQIANDLTLRLGGFSGRLTHIVGNLLTIESNLLFDAVISFLCFLHIEEKSSLFKNISKLLKYDGRMYMEDFIAPEEPISSEADVQLKKYVSCPSLLTKNEYIDILAAQGFTVVSFEDMTERWSIFTIARADSYRADMTRHSALHGDVVATAYLDFYTNMSDLFLQRAVLGVRVLVRKTRNECDGCNIQSRLGLGEL